MTCVNCSSRASLQTSLTRCESGRGTYWQFGKMSAASEQNASVFLLGRREEVIRILGVSVPAKNSANSSMASEILISGSSG